MSHKVKYTRKKINEGTLEEWKRVMFEEIAEMRDLTIHTGGRRKIKDNQSSLKNFAHAHMYPHYM